MKIALNQSLKKPLLAWCVILALFIVINTLIKSKQKDYDVTVEDEIPKSLKNYQSRKTYFNYKRWKNFKEEKKDKIAAPGGYEISVENPLASNNYYIDAKLCANIEKFIGNSSVAEFGAGLGQYGRCWLRNFTNLLKADKINNQKYLSYLEGELKGADLWGKPQAIKSWKGYDGASNIEIVTDGWVKYLDLTKQFGLAYEVNWVISLEVVEHLPQEYERVYVDNLLVHTENGIIISTNLSTHMNPNNTYERADRIISLMKDKKYKRDENIENIIKNGTKHSASIVRNSTETPLLNQSLLLVFKREK